MLCFIASGLIFTLIFFCLFVIRPDMDSALARLLIESILEREWRCPFAWIIESHLRPLTGMVSRGGRKKQAAIICALWSKSCPTDMIILKKIAIFSTPCVASQLGRHVEIELFFFLIKTMPIKMQWEFWKPIWFLQNSPTCLPSIDAMQGGCQFQKSTFLATKPYLQ